MHKMLKATKQILSRSNSQICIVQILDYFFTSYIYFFKKKNKISELLAIFQHIHLLYLTL